MKPGTAAKAFILNSRNELLLIKRADDDAHKPGTWEVPGGRLEPGEDLISGLKRETKEESGLDVEVADKLKFYDFVREDGQKIHMTTFLCRPASNSQPVVLSHEHTEHCWIRLEEACSRLIDDFHPDLKAILELRNL